MTFDDDFVLLKFDTGRPVTLFCKANGIEWPPPEKLSLELQRAAEPTVKDRITFHRTNFSEITDEQRAGMTHVCRGAEYTALPRGQHHGH